MSSTSMRSPKRPAPSPRSEPGGTGPGRDLALGVDLGATKVVALVTDRTGRVVGHSGRWAHSNDGPGPVIRVLLRAVQACLPDVAPMPQSVGISVAAQVDSRNGSVLYAPNLRWRHVPLGAIVGKALGRDVRVLNDARAATYGEWKLGAGVGCSDLFCLMIGTGVGGSAVMGGRLVDGGGSAAGEVGHIPIVSGGRRCHCPGSGCFEAYVGGWAVAQRAQELARAHPRSARALIARAGSARTIRAETVFSAARAGDPLARALVAETERYLEDGAVGVVNAFNPKLLVLGGGMVGGNPPWVRVVQRAVRTRCQPPAAAVRVVPAALGEDAPAIGAAAYARSNFRSNSANR
jgi:glucokinase